MTNQKEHHDPMNALATVSIILLVIFILIMCLSNGRYISSDTAFVCTSIVMMYGVGVVLGVIEYKIMAPLKPFVVARLSWAVSIAAIVFAARAGTSGDVNDIFHIDPSALPMTVAVGTVLKIFTWSRWIFTFGFLFSAFMVYQMITEKYFSDETSDSEKKSIQIITVCALVSLGLCAFFSHFEFHDPEKFRQGLYRIAHMTDFSGSFNCQGYNSQNLDALFIGPNQKQALFAPKLPEDYFFTKGPTLFAPVQIPSEFPIDQCFHKNVPVKELFE